MEKRNPLIKRILLSFQASAHDNLGGPDAGKVSLGFEPLSLHPNLTERPNDYDSEEKEPRIGNFRKVWCRMPVFIPMDRSVGTLTETIVEGKAIACFDTGGEKRLCLPQMLNSILDCFTLPQINAAYDELHIFSSLCSATQLDLLKHRNILPASAASCGLITKTNAERLCSWLLHHREDVLPEEKPTITENSFYVIHKCFGKGRGIFMCDRYVSATSRAICCCDCSSMFTPAEFVCHSHFSRENRVCHWGFESSRWRNYLVLDKNQKLSETVRIRFEEVKRRFDENHTTSTSSLSDADQSEAKKKKVPTATLR